MSRIALLTDRAVGLETNFLWSQSWSWSRLIPIGLGLGLEPWWSWSRSLKLVSRSAIKSALEFAAGDFFLSFEKQNQNKKTFLFNFFSHAKAGGNYTKSFRFVKPG